VASVLSGLTAALGHMSGWVAITLIAVLVFGETAIFLGFVLPGEAAVVFGGVLASRGHLSLPLLIGVVVVTAVTGPMVGYEVGKRMGDRLFTARTLRRVSGPLDRARTTLRHRGGLAVLGGRFLAIVRALMRRRPGPRRCPTGYSRFTTCSEGWSGESATACSDMWPDRPTWWLSAESASAWRSRWRPLLSRPRPCGRGAGTGASR